jgi:hypothetical protein
MSTKNRDMPKTDNLEKEVYERVKRLPTSNMLSSLEKLDHISNHFLSKPQVTPPKTRLTSLSK